VESLEPGSHHAVRVILGLRDLVVHLIHDANRHGERAEQVNPTDAGERQHRAGVRDDNGDIDGLAGHGLRLNPDPPRWLAAELAPRSRPHMPVGRSTRFEWARGTQRPD